MSTVYKIRQKSTGRFVTGFRYDYGAKYRYVPSVGKTPDSGRVFNSNAALQLHMRRKRGTYDPTDFEAVVFDLVESKTVPIGE